MTLRNHKPALILIDIQKGFDHESHWGGQRNNKNAELNSGIILDKWRSYKLPVFHVRHSSTHPDSPLHKNNPGFEFKNEVKPWVGEPVITKQVNSAFIGTELKKQ